MTKRILITGGAGQLGTDLATHLAYHYRGATITTTDLYDTAPAHLESGVYRKLDITNKEALRDILQDVQPDHIYHLAALLSGTAENKPDLAWQLNLDSYKNLLDAIRDFCPSARIFFPSSIAVFGPSTPKSGASQAQHLDPTSMYGVTKAAGEQISNYYAVRYNLDIRSLRFPGLMSTKAKPGGGTTDYSVDIFHAAVEGRKFLCYLRQDTAMPFLLMEDALEGITQLMDADSADIKIRTSYNIHGFSATPKDFIEAIISSHIPLEVEFSPDYRQAIADSWPAALQDQNARDDWGWAPKFDLPSTCKRMLEALSQPHSQTH